MLKICSAFILPLFLAWPAHAQGVSDITITGDSVTMRTSASQLSIDVSLSFEKSVGLTASNLGVSSHSVSLTDSALLARLPAGTEPALGLLIRIEPPTTGGLSFGGLMTMEVHTHNLQYQEPCPLRLFSAPLNGPFRDITTSMGAGSYRARGNTGGFSEFLIVADSRALDTVIEDKFDRLADLLTTYDSLISDPLGETLSDQLEEALADYNNGATLEAIAGIDAFSSTVHEQSEETLANVWRSAHDVVNIAGMLRAAALTLRFSLVLQAHQEA